MRILFIGDSIIRGTVGVNWVQGIARAFPQWKIVNEGVNGDTMVKINQRLEAILKKDTAFDHIVYAGGANDILIPHLSSKGRLFKAAQKHLLKNGYSPGHSPEDFERAYQQGINIIRRYSTANIILVTLGKMNESDSFVLNEKRKLVNQVIRRISQREKCSLADAGQRIDLYLKDKPVKDHFLDGFFNTALFDRWQCRLFGRADSLSEERGLIVTIDGLHLNSIGGEIFRNEVEKHLL